MPYCPHRCPTNYYANSFLPYGLAQFCYCPPSTCFFLSPRVIFILATDCPGCKATEHHLSKEGGGSDHHACFTFTFKWCHSICCYCTFSCTYELLLCCERIINTELMYYKSLDRIRPTRENIQKVQSLFKVAVLSWIQKLWSSFFRGTVSWDSC